MYKPFIHDNFILETKYAEDLYHGYAKSLSIIDYHCHLIPEEIANDKKWDNLSQIWLKDDHYKWRAMRTNGIDEKYITGNSSDWEKFEKWAETVPATIRNPLYHWTHLELKKPFGITKLLNPYSAESIYKETAEKLQDSNFSAKGIIKQWNVEVICTTDDPTDNLEHHIKLNKNKALRVLPTWRPDLVLALDDTVSYNAYIDKLANVSGITISTYENLLLALQNRHDYFANNGCKLADHGINEFYADNYTLNEVKHIFSNIRSGNNLNTEERSKLKSALLYELSLMNHNKNWVQQFHYGALRNNNQKMFDLLGPNTGYDSIGEPNVAVNLSNSLNRLEQQNALAKTIIYNLNPKDNDMIASMIGNFQDGKTPGKIQFGPAWWFLDQKDGMEAQLNALSNQSLLSRFVGMLTDSRSFLSYSRHEYFRRILCNLLGNDINKGLIPKDINMIGKMVENICYYNAKNYFEF